MIYKSFSAGFLVKDKKVLLVHHNKFDKWVPPGGRIEEGEAPTDAVCREFLEETSLIVTACSPVPDPVIIDTQDSVLPLPFHMFTTNEGFNVPHIGYYYYVRCDQDNLNIAYQESELKNVGWFSQEDLQNLNTFEHARAWAAYAINNYPN